MSGIPLPHGRPDAAAADPDRDRVVFPRIVTTPMLCKAIAGRASRHAGVPSGISPQDVASLHVDLARPATCATCGCTDDHACSEGCYWRAVDHSSRTGIYSSCTAHLDAWLAQHADAGGGAP